MKRKKRKAKPGRTDDKALDNAIRGLIPWTVAGFREFVQQRHKLGDTPKDDWPTKPHDIGINVVDDDGSASRLVINQYDPLFQMNRFLHDLYGDLAMAHMIRVLVIERFLEQHSETLQDKHLIVDGKDESYMHESLAEVLVRAPFSAETTRYVTDSGEVAGPDAPSARAVRDYTFDFDSIVEEALKLKAKNFDKPA